MEQNRYKSRWERTPAALAGLSQVSPQQSLPARLGGQGPGTPQGRGTLYREITAKIIAELEAGRVPWVQPWRASATVPAMPINAATERRYSGINVLMLWAAAVEGATPASGG